MDKMQDFVSRTIEAQRKLRMANSDQLTLGKLVELLKPIVEVQKAKGKDEARVCFDFASLFPTELYSWRGSYAEIALNYKADGDGQLRVSDFLSLIQNAIGATYVGYKGGDFTMQEDTPIWVSEHNRSGNTAVVGVMDNGYEVVILTAFRNY